MTTGQNPSVRTTVMALRQLKTKIAVAALLGDQTVAESAEKFEIHHNQIAAWITQLLERSS